MTVHIIGVDDGFAGTKIFGDHPEKDGEVVQHIIPSRARSGRHAITSVLSDKDDSDAYEAGGENWTVGKYLDGEDTRFEHYATSSMNRAIVNHALNSAGFSGKEVAIITGLPFTKFYSNTGTVNKDLVKAKMASLMEPVKRVSGRENAVISEHRVSAEALCAVIDIMVDIKGNYKPTTEMMAVVDIGGNTTDICVVTPSIAIDHKRSGTKNIGMLNVYNSISDLIESEFGVSSLQDEDIRQSVITKKIKMWGEDKDISHIVNSSLEDEAGNIVREANRRFGQGADLSKIILVGGGAEPMYPFINKHFANAFLPEDAEFANARGMYKYRKYVA